MTRTLFSTFILMLLLTTFFVGPVLAVPGTEKGLQSLPENLRGQAAKILAQYQKLQHRAEPERYVTLDLEDNAVVSVFNKPGIFSTEDCARDAIAAESAKKKKAVACATLGTADRQARLSPTGNVEFRVEEDQVGKPILRTYTEVQLASNREAEKTTTGWVAQDYISFKPTTPSYANIVIEKFEQAKGWLQRQVNRVCKSETQTESASTRLGVSQKNLTDIAQISDTIQQNTDKENQRRQQVTRAAEQLSGRVGKCVLKPPDVAPTRFSGSIVYDQYVLPSVKTTQLPKELKREGGQPLTQENLVDIDSLARTIYAEMASCVSLGAQYPMAVARVIRNRAFDMQQNSSFADEYITNNSEHDRSKSLLCKAATSPVHFSAWNQHIIDFEALEKARLSKTTELMKKMSTAKAVRKARSEIRPDPKSKAYYKPNRSGLLHTLCPPSDPNGTCYTGEKPDAKSSTAWKSILRVAVEAVLFPEQFDQKTDALKNVKHYTSDRTKFYDFVQVKASIEGRQISSSRCLNLWKPKPSSVKKNK